MHHYGFFFIAAGVITADALQRQYCRCRKIEKVFYLHEHFFMRVNVRKNKVKSPPGLPEVYFNFSYGIEIPRENI